MEPDAPPASLIHRAWRTVFRAQVRLRWSGRPALELVDPQLAGRPDPAEVARERAEAELVAMRRELAATLDDLPDARELLRHLAYLEHALGQQGLAALDHLPLALLSRALDEFEGLVTNWSPVGLATLRSKMAVTLARRRAVEEVYDEGSSTAAAVAYVDRGSTGRAQG